MALVERTRTGAVTVLRFRNPPVNAVDLDVARTFNRELEAALASDTGALVLTGDGHCFSAGLNLKVVPRYGAAEQREMVATANRMLGRLYGAPIPTVAAVNGHAIAAGLVLALACDYRVGTTGVAEYGLSEARVGIPFPGAAMAIVQGELAPPAARRLTLVARNLDGDEAAALGVLDERVPPERVLERATAVATELTHLPRAGYARIKAQLRAPALAGIATVVAGADPMLDAWFDPEAQSASRAVLGSRAALRRES